MQKFLVVSYDTEEDQWFWDFVVSDTEENAEKLVLKRRPYVVAADAATKTQLARMAKNLGERSIKFISDQFDWDTYSDDMPTRADAADKGQKEVSSGTKTK